MKVIGFSAGVIGRDSNVDRLVKKIMDETGYETEFLKLTEIDYPACKGCVWLCAEPEVCRYDDELLPYFQKVKEADAVVLGTPNHFGTVSATMISFISRFWGFRHVNFAIKNKPIILAVSALKEEQLTRTGEDFRKALNPFHVDVVDVVHYCSTIPPCYRCGRHQECRIGGAYGLWGKEVSKLEITEDLFRVWEDSPMARQAIEGAVSKLKEAVGKK